MISNQPIRKQSKMKEEKFDIKTMYDEVEWTPLQKSSHGGTRVALINHDQVGVIFCESKKDSGKIDRMIIRIGENITERLSWDKGDKIVVMQNPKNLMEFMLVKTEAGDGFVLGVINKTSRGFRIQLPWRHEKPLNKCQRVVDHFIKNRKLIIFNVNSDKRI
jgi:hypothetical protein